MSTHRIASRRRSAGFTLIEAMIATSISGIVASLAYPSVSAAVHKARRSEALVAMAQVQLAQERWRSNSSRYATLAELGLPDKAPGGHYRIVVADATPAGYAAIAQATAAQAADRACRYLKLALDAGTVVYSSGDNEATTNDAATNRQCWKL
jgi:type IV pilus assembly protein PilE